MKHESKCADAKKVERIIRMTPVPKGLYNGFRQQGWEERLPAVYTRSAELLTEHAGGGWAKQMHMKQLLPMIAFYEAAQELTGSREGALAFFEAHAFTEAQKMVKPARFLMKLGLYRLMPTLCGLMLDMLFGKKAGFDYRPVPDAPKFSVDMTVCPYFETCKRYGVPELTQFACRADDITYGNLHPKLVWARTQTLGTGGSCCDFRLHLKED